MNAPQSQGGPNRKTLMRSLGEFFGHIARGIGADVRTGEPRQVRREVEEREEQTPAGKVVLRRTTIEEIELPPRQVE